MIESQSLSAYLTDLGSKAPAPGGGAAAGLSAAQGAALIEMVCRLTRNHPDEISVILDEAGQAREHFLELAQRDMDCFSVVMQAFRKQDDRLQPALRQAASVPLELIDRCLRLISPLERLQLIGNSNLMTDVGIAALLIEGAMRSSRLNVLVNLKSITDAEFNDAALARLRNAQEQVSRLNSVSAAIDAKLSE